MGISGFWSYYGSLVKKNNLENIKGKIAIIDITLYLHKYIIGIRKNAKNILSKDGKNINHIYALSKIIKNFTDQYIQPIFVFDGKSPVIKSDSVKRRKDISDTANEKCIEIIEKYNENDSEESVDFEEYLKYFKRSFVLTNIMIDECKEYLDICGIPYVSCIGEADPQCAALYYYYQNICCGIFTEDSDMMLYGSDIILRDLNICDSTYSVIYKQDIINFLQEKVNIICKNNNKDIMTFTNKNLLDFSIIMGTDYCIGIRISNGNNRDKLFELFVLSDLNVDNFIMKLNELNNLNELTNKNNQNKFFIPDDFLKKYYTSKTNYENVDIINPSDINIKMNKPNVFLIRKYLEKLNFRNDIIENDIRSIVNLYNYINPIITIKKEKILTSCKQYLQEDDEWKIVQRKKIN